MLYISRLVVSLTHVQSIMAGKLSTQMLMSVGVALVLSLLFAVPALLCVQRDCSPLAHRTLGTLYACNFIFLAGINVSRFAYFASARLNPEAKSWGFALLILLFAVYGALVGLQGVMGDAAGLQAFPVYTLSQLAGSGSMVRMDALYTGFWIFAIFIKAALLIYCAAVTLPGSGGHKGKCLGAGLAAFAVSCALGRLMTVGQHSPLITVVPFAMFSSLIPLVWLLGHRKARGTNETNH